MLENKGKKVMATPPVAPGGSLGFSPTLCSGAAFWTEVRFGASGNISGNWPMSLILLKHEAGHDLMPRVIYLMTLRCHDSKST